MALLSKRTIFKGEAVPFVMELPNYRMPGIQNVAHLLWDKAKDFLQRAFTVIFLATIVVWFLQTFDFQLNVVADSPEQHFGGHRGGDFSPFVPLGFGDWRVSTALIAGFMAKESVVSTLSVLFGSTEQLLVALTPLAVASLLVFCLLYTPCVAAIASIRRELGGKWAVGGGGWTMCDCVGLRTPGAWTGTGHGDNRMNLTSVLILALVLLASVLAVRVLWTRRGSCHGCGGFAARAGKIKPMMSKTTSVQYSLSHRKPPLSRNLGRGIFLMKTKRLSCGKKVVING